jgi:hypothetical protein
VLIQKRLKRERPSKQVPGSKSAAAIRLQNIKEKGREPADIIAVSD